MSVQIQAVSNAKCHGIVLGYRLEVILNLPHFFEQLDAVGSGTDLIIVYSRHVFSFRCPC